MNRESTRFVQFIESRFDALAEELAEGSLVVAVFGPGFADDSLGSRKRQQIVETLRDDGHEAFTPETMWEVREFDLRWLDQEQVALANDRVDFVIVLVTETSIGAIGEIGRISGDAAITPKTGVLYPRWHYSPDEDLMSDTVQAFTELHLYTEGEIESCDLVAKCRDWIADEQHDVGRRAITSTTF